jgi:hypothetical protein
MILFPFKTIFLKSSVSRKQIETNLKENTYLSDANFNKSETQKVLFYGEISEFDFSLETLNKKSNMVRFIQGKILGIENDLYLSIQFGAFKYRRVYTLLMLVICSLLGTNIYYCLQNPHGFNYPEEFYQQYGYDYSEFLFNLTTPISLCLSSLTLLLLLYTVSLSSKFFKQTSNTIHYLNELFQSHLVTAIEVPLVFRQ